MRTTKARTEIMKIFTSHTHPLDAQVMHDILKKKDVQVDLATIYRTLSRFQKENIIKHVDFADGITRYELSSLPHHHHAICVKCGRIQDIPLHEDQRLTALVEKDLQFTVQSHHMEFFGLCSTCR